jgi:hypothetical protein
LVADAQSKTTEQAAKDKAVKDGTAEPKLSSEPVSEEKAKETE